MPTLTVRRPKGINRADERFELADGEFVRLYNLLPSEEALVARPGRVRYLTQLSGVAPASGLHRFYRGGDAPNAQGARQPATIVNDPAFGSLAWANPGNAGYSDDAKATASPLSATNSQLLKATAFGHTIPATATIRGMMAEIERSALGTVQDARVWIVKAGVVQTGTPSKALSANWPLTSAGQPPTLIGADVIQAYGGPTDLWGTTLTPADVNNAGFGVAIAATGQNAAQARIDMIRVTVYFDIYGTPGEGRETLLYVAATLYSDKTGAWASISGASTLLDDANLEILTWLSKAWIQDGANGPYKYDGTTFSLWDNGGIGGQTAPPIGKYMLFDEERFYITGIAGDASAVRICTVGNPEDFPNVASPTDDDAGLLMYAGRGDGDYTTGIGKLGTMKFIFKRLRAFRLIGDSPATWDLEPIFPVGAVAHRCIWDCGGRLVWTNGRRVFMFDGQRLHHQFGRRIEPLLEETPMDEWPKRCAVFWRGLYILWYRADACVAFDFSRMYEDEKGFGPWYGPWESIPARIAVVDRDSDVIWVGSSVRGEIWKIEGTTDDGLHISCTADGKAYDHGLDAIKRPRSIFVTADGEIGPVIATLKAYGDSTQTGAREVVRSFSFTGTAIRTLRKPISPGADGQYLATELQWEGPKKIYEYGVTADGLRRR